jgi:hypothetical protein
MLDRPKAEAASRRSRAVAFSISACVALAIAGWLAYTGISYVRDGCGCYEPIADEVYGAVLLIFAGVFLLASAALALRAIRLFTTS